MDQIMKHEVVNFDEANSSKSAIYITESNSTLIFSSRKRETYGDGATGTSGSSDDAFADALSMPEREDVSNVNDNIETVLKY